MSCCPRPDRTPLDPDREGPSEDDIARFGDDDLPYTEFAGEAAGPETSANRSFMRTAAPLISGVAIVAFLVVVILIG
jgi:hypothetical protein